KLLGNWCTMPLKTNSKTVITNTIPSHITDRPANDEMPCMNFEDSLLSLGLLFSIITNIFRLFYWSKSPAGSFSPMNYFFASGRNCRLPPTIRQTDETQKVRERRPLPGAEYLFVVYTDCR